MEAFFKNYWVRRIGSGLVLAGLVFGLKWAANSGVLWAIWAWVWSILDYRAPVWAFLITIVVLVGILWAIAWSQSRGGEPRPNVYDYVRHYYMDVFEGAEAVLWRWQYRKSERTMANGCTLPGSCRWTVTP